MNIGNVRVVVTPEELDRIGEFRYGIYIEEQRKNAPYADHVTRRLIEPIDRVASSLVYYLEDEGRITATMRVEFLDEAHHAHRCAFDLFDFMPPSQMMHFTRLMVARDARRSDATPKLLFLGFALALLKDRCLGLLTCKPELVSVFEMYGCLQYADPMVHPECGPQVPMAILGEVDYLSERAAPLAAWLEEHRKSSLYTRRFLDRIEAYSTSRSIRKARNARCLVA